MCPTYPDHENDQQVCPPYSPCVHQVCPPHLDGLPLFLLHRQRHVLGGIVLYYISLLSDGGLSKDIIVIISMVT